MNGINNLYQVRPISKDWKAKYLKVFGSNRTKEPKRSNQNQIRSPMPEGREP
jgi:hypothetical protein